MYIHTLTYVTYVLTRCSRSDSTGICASMNSWSEPAATGSPLSWLTCEEGGRFAGLNKGLHKRVFHPMYICQ